MMVSSTPQKWTLAHRAAMPSTRRSQALPADPAQQRHSSSVSLSPKLSRSARLLPPDDPVEKESAARGAKRLKSVTPSLDEAAAVHQNAEHHNSDHQAHEDKKSVQHTASSDEKTNKGQYEDAVPEEQQCELDESTSDPAAPTRPEPDPVEPHPTTTPVPADASELESLADQILDVNIRTTTKELASGIVDPSSEIGKEYVQLRTKFVATKQQYSGIRPFISPSDLGLSASTHVGICRRINLATFVTSLFFGSVGLEELDNYFLFTFLPRGGTLSKLAASLWIELKTQAFIVAVGCDSRPPSAILSVLFTEDVRHRLLDVRPGAEDLAQSEEDFMTDMRSRRDALKADLAKMDPTTLAQNYPWMALLDNVASYISILKLDDQKLTGSERLLLKPRQSLTQPGEENGMTQTNGTTGNARSHLAKVSSFLDTPEESFQHRLARCALIAIQAHGVPFFTHDGYLPYPLIRNSDQLQEEEPAVADKSTTPFAEIPSDASPVDEASVPHSSQTAPTLVLYARAREASELEALHPPQATVDGNSKVERREWSLGEEQALMDGLDRLRGPHWGEILADGKLSDRTETEAKDKARSLKLFFMKAGIEVPFYLKDASMSGSSTVAPKQEEDQPSAVSTPAEAEST